MLDIHCHLLPGLDDGASEMPVAVEMAKLLVAAGFTTVAASPHMGGGPGGDVSEADAAQARDLLHAQLDQSGIALTVLPGAEHHVTPDIFAKADRGALTPIGDRGRFLLVEFPWGGVPQPDALLFRLQLKGFKLVLAHPERYGFLEPAAAIAMAQRGIFLQLELGSFVGLYGDRAERRAATLMEAGAAHVLATDLHRPDDAPRWISAALHQVAHRFGEEALLRGTRDNPQRLVDDATADQIVPMVG